jgi:hypothetical protein
VEWHHLALFVLGCLSKIKMLNLVAWTAQWIISGLSSITTDRNKNTKL